MKRRQVIDSLPNPVWPFHGRFVSHIGRCPRHIEIVWDAARSLGLAFRFRHRPFDDVDVVAATIVNAREWKVHDPPHGGRSSVCALYAQLCYVNLDEEGTLTRPPPRRHDVAV